MGWGGDEANVVGKKVNEKKGRSGERSLNKIEGGRREGQHKANEAVSLLAAFSSENKCYVGHDRISTTTVSGGPEIGPNRRLYRAFSMQNIYIYV